VRAVALVGALATSLVACGDDPAAPPTEGDTGELGGSARTMPLAEGHLEGRPKGGLAWIADEVRLRPGEPVAHRHELAFVYGRRGAHNVRKASGRARVGRGMAVFVEAGARHRHTAGARGSTFWEIRLAPSGASRPSGGRRVFESEPLEGIPPRAAARFIGVTVPPRGGRTTVHTHPGPEFIYQLSGRIDYQNAIIGTKRLGPGGAEGIPPGTAVQKRNPFARPATFLSLFLVDPNRPFAPRASF
jgi:quercetin dioxygenase-like cupin family protein